MTRKYQWTPQAREEMKNALHESRLRWGVEQRDNYRRQVSETVKALARNPRMGIERPKWGDNVRSFVVGRHILVYVVDGQVVIITRVLHQHEDLERALGLKEEDPFD